jgi:universal stress protein F
LRVQDAILRALVGTNLMYKHILVPVAFEADSKPEKALEVARTLADKDARVTLLHVMEEAPPYAISYIPEDDLRNLREAIQAELDELARGFDNGIGLLIEGHAGRTILEWAKENAPDCIVIASHRPGLEDYFLGSTASHIVRRAQCAVHVLR